MDAKTVVGKSLFFIAICLFVSLFAVAFGSKNSLTGVVIVVLALMMLGRDLSVRPMMNLVGLTALTLAMGLGSFASVWCGNAWLAAVINFGLVFAFSFLTTQDLRSPMHFPFLLGYAFMLSVPVTTEQLPVRLLALVLGCAFTVALNVLVNRGRHDGTCRSGVVRLCCEVKRMCLDALEGREVSRTGLDALCTEVRDSMLGRLRTGLFTSQSDRRVLDLVSSIQMMGGPVCSGSLDDRTLRDLTGLLDLISSHESGDTDLGCVVDRAEGFLSSHPGTDPRLSAAVAMLEDALSSVSGDRGRRDVRGTVRGLAMEGFRTDSARFSFAVRMSVIFTLWAFVWQFWELENAKWLMFTTVALVVPYTDGAWRKAAMRLSGTLLGVVAFAVVLALFGGDVGALTAALLVANYLYTVMDPKRYDVMMVFITFSALVAASMSAPAGDAVVERIAFILMGVASATVANYLVLPYRTGDENAAMARRYVVLMDRMRGCLRSALDGRRDRDLEDVLTMSAAGVSAKMRANVSAGMDPEADRFLSLQDCVASELSYLCGKASGLSDHERECARMTLEGGGPPGLPVTPYLSVLSGTVAAMDEAERMVARVGRPSCP